MFENKKLVIELNNDYFKILYGNNKNITNYLEMRNLEELENKENLNSTDLIVKVIKNYIEKEKIHATKISFSVRNKDILVRNLVIPLVNSKNIREITDFEIRQSFQEYKDRYYITYGLIGKLNSSSKKGYNLIVIATPKLYINQCLKISKALGLNLKSIDLYGNCFSRHIRKTYSNGKLFKRLIIIEIGYNLSSIMLFKNTKLIDEKEILTGIKDVESSNKALEELSIMINRILSFYHKEYLEENINEVFLLTEAINYDLLSTYLNCKLTQEVKPFNNLPSKLKIPKGFFINNYFSLYGLLIRKE